MKITALPVVIKTVLILVLLLDCSLNMAQGKKRSKEEEKARQERQLQELNKTLLSDEQKQTELMRLFEGDTDSLLQQNDTIAEYLTNLDLLIDVRQREHIDFRVILREDCRELIRNDLKELTENGLRAGYSFKRISAINDAYLRDVYREYRRKYRGNWMYRPELYGRSIPEFGRDDYLKAIRNIFTTIVTLRIKSLIEGVNVVVYSMQQDKFVANSTGKTELILPLETGSYVVELSKPGYKRKLKKVVLGKYPKTIVINEPLLMQ